MRLTNGQQFFEITIDNVLGEYLSGIGFGFRITADAAFIAVDYHTYSYSTYFRQFLKELEKSYENLCGTVIADSFSYEKDIIIKIEFLKLGAVNVTLFVKSNDCFGNEARVSFITDQTFVGDFIRQGKRELEELGF